MRRFASALLIAGITAFSAPHWSAAEIKVIQPLTTMGCSFTELFDWVIKPTVTVNSESHAIMDVPDKEFEVEIQSSDKCPWKPLTYQRIVTEQRDGFRTEQYEILLEAFNYDYAIRNATDNVLSTRVRTEIVLLLGVDGHAQTPEQRAAGTALFEAADNTSVTITGRVHFVPDDGENMKLHIHAETITVGRKIYDTTFPSYLYGR